MRRVSSELSRASNESLESIECDRFASSMDRACPLHFPAQAFGLGGCQVSSLADRIDEMVRLDRDVVVTLITPTRIECTGRPHLDRIEPETEPRGRHLRRMRDSSAETGEEELR
jgi:hypothetical protein